MQIATDFEGGRIELKASNRAVLAAGAPAGADLPPASSRAGGDVVVLTVPADHAAPKFRQWFAFEARGAPGIRQEFRIDNANECTWADAFGGLYKVFASYDDEHWFRVETRFADGRLAFWHTPIASRVRYALSPPFSSARLARLLVEVRALKGAGGPARAVCEPLVATSRGQLHHIEIGSDDAAAKDLWIIAQQHPGEPMAGWFVEGLIERIVSADERAKELVGKARLHVVPRMNPDGCALANHRTNEKGLDLNREWGHADTASVEVKAAREAMKKARPRFFLDVHGDERLPYLFAQPADRYTGRAARFLELENAFDAAMLRHEPNYQTEHRYPFVVKARPNTAIASSWAQSEFGCLALTLEMPFSDNKNAPRDEGWSPERSKHVGAAMVDVLLDLLPEL